MKTRAAFTLAALAALAASPALAQEGGGAAPAKHVNKITDAAKAAFERMGKAMYSAPAVGLKDLTGTMEIKMGDGGVARPGMPSMSFAYSVAFKAPADLKVESKGEGGMMAGAGEGLKKMGVMVLRMSLGLMRPTDEEEYDADAATVDGKTVVTITSFVKGVEADRNALTLDERGVIESAASTSKAAAGGPMRGGPGGRGGMGGGAGGDAEQKSNATFTWRKEGDRWLLEKLTSSSPRGAMDMLLTYADAGGFKVVSSWTMKGPEGAGGAGGGPGGAGHRGMGGGAGFSVHLSDLTVNGKKVEAVPVPTTPPPADGGMGGGK